MPKGSEITPAPLTSGQQIVGRDHVTGTALLVEEGQLVQGAPWAGAGIDDEVLKLFVWEALRSLQVTAWDTSDDPRLPSTGTVTWPFDGAAGVYTTTSIDATWRAVDAFTITHTPAAKTVTVTVVYDATYGDAQLVSITVS